ncbi:DeoR family transcriptional regulator [Streptomyces sp. NPDC006339]|uniref:DeoR family transcriptional regulator n=1 Tax=Streptomyces sp. NPDC006339 TaxID=3156755 RepID=UPI0033AFC499
MNGTATDPRTTRRERVRQLHATGASTRAIAKELNTSKDTVRRDLAHLAQHPDQQEAPPAPRHPRITPALRAEVAQRNAAGADAMRQLASAVAQVEAERVAHLCIPRMQAHQWADELQAHAQALARILDDFRTYYPDWRA